MASSGNFRRATRAFTLVEVVMVLVIIAALSVMAVPRVSSALANQRLNAATRRVASDLAYAQRSARLNSSAFTVAFSIEDNKYVIGKLSGLHSSGKQYEVHLNREPYQVALSSASFNGQSAVTFNGFGQPTAGGTVVLRLRSTMRTIKLSETTGGITTE